jgi:hypothetical protein
LQAIKLVLGRGLKNRQRKLDGWLSFRKGGEDNADTESNGFGIFILASTMVLEKTNLGNLVLLVLRDKKLDNHHFLDFLLNNTAFKEFAMLSMGGKLEEWFCTLCKGMKEEEEKIFDETCQILMADILGLPVKFHHCQKEFG